MTTIRSLLLAAALCGLAACGSDGGSGSSAESSPAAEQATPGGGDGTGTLTMADGTAYALAMSTCETSEDGSGGFATSESFDLLGRTSDGAFRVQLNRAGFEEGTVTEIVSLEGDFDENGKNAGLMYYSVLGSMAILVDGGNVSGTMTMTPLGPNRPHGDETVATVDVRC